MKYRFVQDEVDTWFIIPSDKYDSWKRDYQYSEDAPEWAVAIPSYLSEWEFECPHLDDAYGSFR